MDIFQMEHTPFIGSKGGIPSVAPLAKTLARHTQTVFATPLDPIGRSTVMDQTADQTSLALAPNGGCGVASGTAYGAIIGYDTTAQRDSLGLPIDGGPQAQDDSYTFSYRQGQTSTIGFQPVGVRPLPYISGLVSGDATAIAPYATYPYTDSNGVTHAPQSARDRVVRKPKVNVLVDYKTIGINHKNQLYGIPATGSSSAAAAAANGPAYRPGQGIRFEGITPPPVAPTLTAAAGSGLTASASYAYVYIATKSGGPNPAGAVTPATPTAYVANTSDWQAGYNAYKAGSPESANPNAGGSAAGIAWAAAWQQALSDINGSSPGTGGTPPSALSTADATIWSAGYAGYAAGKSATDSPYTSGSGDDATWQTGLQAARSDAILGNVTTGNIAGGDISGPSPVATIVTDSGANCQVSVSIPALDPLVSTGADGISLYRIKGITSGTSGSGTSTPTPPSSVTDTADWTLGYQAFQTGQPLSSNPNLTTTTAGIAWMQGWNQAQADNAAAVPPSSVPAQYTVDWQQGYAANLAGTLESANPYNGATLEAIYWGQGWEQARTDGLNRSGGLSTPNSNTSSTYYFVHAFTGIGAQVYVDSTADGSLGAALPPPTPVRVHTLLATVDDAHDSPLLAGLVNVGHSADSSPLLRGLKINPARVGGVDVSSVAINAGDDANGVQVKIDGTTITRDPLTSVLSSSGGFGCNTTINCAYSHEDSPTIDGVVRSVFLRDSVNILGGTSIYYPLQVGTDHPGNDIHGLPDPNIDSGTGGDSSFATLIRMSILQNQSGGDWPGYHGNVGHVEVDGDLYSSGSARLAQGTGSRTGENPIGGSFNPYLDVGGRVQIGTAYNPSTTALSTCFTQFQFYNRVVMDELDATLVKASTFENGSGSVANFTGGVSFTSTTPTDVGMSLALPLGQSANAIVTTVGGTDIFHVTPSGGVVAAGQISAPSAHFTGTSTLINDGRTDHKAIAAPATPASGYTSIYSKTVSSITRLFEKRDDGTEIELGTSSGGTVTSVGLTAPAFLTVGSSPVTGSGTIALTLAPQTANTVFAGPASGGAATPAFRGLAAADIPDLSATYALAGAVSSGELVMTDGVTNPPVPITNEAGDDWLYLG